ncbi:MAG: cytochrome c [Bryobacteraceae bacterium]|jgi:mono/diheme cytochrome c family protein
MKWRIVAIPIACVGLFEMLCATPGQGQKQRSVMDGVYTAEQAKRGADTYTARCAMCHGAGMQGGPEAPALTGAEFLYSWGGKTAGALYNYMRATMPPTEQGSLSDQRYADLLAAVFQKNEYPAGKTELPADPKALADVVIPKDQ